MSIIIDNYKTITKTIVKNIRDGKIISYDSERLNGLTIDELFTNFVQVFNFTHYRDKVANLEIDDNILKVPFPNKVVYIESIYFPGIGEIILDDLIDTLSSDNALYFDLNNLNIDRQWITPGAPISLNYIGYNEDYS